MESAWPDAAPSNAVSATGTATTQCARESAVRAALLSIDAGCARAAPRAHDTSMWACDHRIASRAIVIRRRTTARRLGARLGSTPGSYVSR